MSTTEVKMIQVSTVPAVTVPAGFWQIVARTRATTDKATNTKKEIAADQRARSILIPELVADVSSKYVSLVHGALAETAKQQLAAIWESDNNVREVAAALFTIDGLLAFSAREAESKKLSAAGILAWFDQSALKAEFAAKYSEAQLKRFRMELENIAAPVLSADYYNEEKALKRIVTLTKNERDSEHETVQLMIAKLQRYVERMQKMREEIGSIEEIPE
jgi:hypothetical protein